MWEVSGIYLMMDEGRERGWIETSLNLDEKGQELD